MKDINIESPIMKIQCIIAWFGFICFGYIVLWIIALLLANYGRITSNDVDKKKNILNKTWQKFIFVYGSIVGDIAIILILYGVFFL